MRYLTTLEPFGLANSAFDRLWSGLNQDLARSEERSGSYTPRVDVVEAPDAYTIELEIPGVDPKAVEVTLLDDVLTVRGEKPARRDLGETERSWSSERSHGQFERRFRFPVAVDADGVTAQAANGVLSLRVAKAPEAKPHRIEIDA